MAVLVYKGPSITVDTIADRNAILRKIDNMVVTVKDAIADPEAGPGYATYRYNASLDIWILEAEEPDNETITLTGDVTGSGAYGDLGATIEVTVKDDSHNHIISNIDGLSAALNGKVDKITGKGLSTEDYTSEEKTKLGTIESGAQVNDPTDISIGGTGNSRTILSSTGGGASIPLASSTTAGFMSISDKLKLSGIESGATKNATDLQLRNRSTHHGTQAISTIDGLQDALDTQASGLETHTHTLDDITDSGNLAGINTNGSPTNYLNGSGAWSTPPNTTYSEITTAEIDAGTSSTRRTITGRRLKYALDKKADISHTHDVSDITGLSDAATTSIASIRAGTTAADVGLGNVLNVASYSKTEADANFLGKTAKAADSDKLDNLNSTQFVRSDAADTTSAPLTIDTFAKISSESSISGAGNDSIFASVQGTTWPEIRLVDTKGFAARITANSGSTWADLLIAYNDNTFTYMGNKIWHAGNNGSGSGLDADKLDGKELSTIEQEYESADIATLTSAKNYADGVGTTTLASAKSYTDTAVSNLLDSAPGALDTLNELAAALGDDPNFATTISNQISGKLDSAAYTAADVLTKIKTVDGSGSGLDADLLDGNNSSYYRSWTNITNKPSPVITLAGDLTGSVTLSSLTSGTLTATIKDNSHNHTSLVDVISVDFDSGVSQSSSAITTAATSQVMLGTFDASIYGSAEVTVTATSGSDRHLSKMLIVHDGVEASATEYGIVTTGAELFTVDAEYVSGNVNVMVTPSVGTNMEFKVFMTKFEV